MAMIAKGFINHQQVEDDIARAASLLGPEVVRINHSFGDDHNGEPAVYFRVVLRDSSFTNATRREVVGKIERTLIDEMQLYSNWGIWPYISFRSQSEQETRKMDLDWE